MSEMQDKRDREISMFGCEVSEFMDDAQKSFFIRFPEHGGWKMLVASYLSDVQELMAMGGAANIESARQTINRAKYIIDKKL